MSSIEACVVEMVKLGFQRKHRHNIYKGVYLHYNCYSHQIGWHAL